MNRISLSDKQRRHELGRPPRRHIILEPPVRSKRPSKLTGEKLSIVITPISPDFYIKPQTFLVRLGQFFAKELVRIRQRDHGKHLPLPRRYRPAPQHRPKLPSKRNRFVGQTG